MAVTILPLNLFSVKNQTRFRVRYAETDQMGIVHHANYLIWMEIGRAELVRSLGVDYHHLEENEGLFLSVIHASCRYVYPARYDQEVCVETELTVTNARSAEFVYRISASDPDKLLAEGGTRHIWLNKTLRPARLPAHYIALLHEGLSPQGRQDPGQEQGLSLESQHKNQHQNQGLSPERAGP